MPPSSVQAHTHIVAQPAAEDAVSSEAHASDSENITETVVVDLVGRTAAPTATETGVLRKTSPRKICLARSTEKGDGSVFIPASSLFPTAAPNNPVEPVQRKEIGDSAGQKSAAPLASKPPISPKPRTKIVNRIGVSRATARE